MMRSKRHYRGKAKRVKPEVFGSKEGKRKYDAYLHIRGIPHHKYNYWKLKTSKGIKLMKVKHR